MTPAARAKISASLRENQHRKGIPHSQETRSQIAESVRNAYAEGRHKICLRPENLAQFNKDVKAGKRANPRMDPARDAGIAASYYKHRCAHRAAAEWGITYSAVYYALARAGAMPIRKGGG